MITILTTVILSQLVSPPMLGMFEMKNMIQRTTGQADSWDYTSNSSFYGNINGRGFRSVSAQSNSQAKAKAKAAEKKNPNGKVECGENCLCTQLTEQEVKDLKEFIKQQKERQLQMERFRQQNPNGPPFGFGRNRQQTQPKAVD